MLGSTHMIRRAAGALALTAAVAVLAVPAALAGGNGPALVDGRSPDTVDAGISARYGQPDRWFAQVLAQTGRQQQDQVPPLVDGRSADTVDAGILAHAPTVTIYRSSGFAWADFAIGIAAAFGLMALVVLSVRLVMARSHQSNPVATA
jgi:hypothetical protein